jgi:hypothetical protein
VSEYTPPVRARFSLLHTSPRSWIVNKVTSIEQETVYSSEFAVPKITTPAINAVIQTRGINEEKHPKSSLNAKKSIQASPD